MNIRRERPPIKKSQLENEVIFAVVVLYALLSAALLAIHYWRPGGSETLTSSTSPSHSDFSAVAAERSRELTVSEVEAMLAREGYGEVGPLVREGTRYRTTAIKSSRSWEIEVDAVSRVIVQTASDGA